MLLRLPPFEMFRVIFRLPNFESDPRAHIELFARVWKPLEVLAVQALVLAGIFHYTLKLAASFWSYLVHYVNQNLFFKSLQACTTSVPPVVMTS
jgi:hypothetical protein